MGKSTISTGPFSIAMLNYQRVNYLGKPANSDHPLNFMMPIPGLFRAPRFWKMRDPVDGGEELESWSRVERVHQSL